MMGAGVEINLNDAPLYAGEKLIEGKAGEHQQALVGKILPTFFEFAVSDDVETITGFLSHQVSEIIETPIRFGIEWTKSNSSIDGAKPSCNVGIGSVGLR